MFDLVKICKTYTPGMRPLVVYKDFSFSLPKGRSLGLLGKNGAGKSTLLKILCGAILPDSGEVIRHGSISWPVGLAGGLLAAMTGRDNVRFVCRLQGVSGKDLDRRTAFVHEFSELGDHFDRPVGAYSSGMRARLNFSLSLAFDFDCFLFDEVMAVGDQSFREKAADELRIRKQTSSFVLASHNLHDIRDHSDSVLVLQHGQQPIHFDNVQEGINFYRSTYSRD